MTIRFDSDVPLYIQIAEEIEDGILSGAFAEETQVPSTTEISVTYKINPATVLKGMTILAEEDVLYKKRGIGMFVRAGAADRIRRKRRRAFYQAYILRLLAEADKLGIGREDIIEMIKGETSHDKHD